MTARIEYAEPAGGTRTRRPATLTGTRRTYDLQSSTTCSLRALARESPEERETRRQANADTMRESRARESREEGETQRQANADAMREARAKEIADRGLYIGCHTPTLTFRKYCCSRPNVHTKVAEASNAILVIIHVHMYVGLSCYIYIYICTQQNAYTVNVG